MWMCACCAHVLFLSCSTPPVFCQENLVCSVKVLEVACERCKTQVLPIGCGGKDLLVEIWLFVLTCNIYVSITTQALLLVGAVTEHWSVNSPDTSVGLDKAWLYLLMCMVENRLKDLQLHAKLFWVVWGQSLPCVRVTGVSWKWDSFMIVGEKALEFNWNSINRLSLGMQSASSKGC